MTQTLLEESKLLRKSYTSSSLDKDENINNENHALIHTADNIDLSIHCGESTLKGVEGGSTEIYNHAAEEESRYLGTNGVDSNQPVYPLNGECDVSPLDPSSYKHLYPNVVVQNPNDLSDVDSDEEDFQLRMHNKCDSGQGSSVETSSLKSGTQDFYQVDIRLDDSSGVSSNAGVDNEILDNVLDDSDLAINETFTRRHSSITSRIQEADKKLEEMNFTDIPLNTPNTPSSKRPPVNTFTPTSGVLDNNIDNVPSQQAILKPPTVTDTPANGR